MLSHPTIGATKASLTLPHIGFSMKSRQATLYLRISLPAACQYKILSLTFRSYIQSIYTSPPDSLISTFSSFEFQFTMTLRKILWPYFPLFFYASFTPRLFYVFLCAPVYLSAPTILFSLHYDWYSGLTTPQVYAARCVSWHSCPQVPHGHFDRGFQFHTQGKVGA